MQVLHAFLPEPIVPEVFFTDRDNYVFAMSHAPTGARVWKESLLSGEVNQAVAERAGYILGLMHETTGRNTKLIDHFRDHTVFVQLRVDPFYRRIQERRPEVATEVQRIADRMLETKEALCHGDYSPKNILTHNRGFTLVDYETAHFGDPTMDLGFFLSHLMLKALKRDDIQQQFFELTRTFWRSYLAQVHFRAASELEVRGIEHFGVCLLARIDGTSPVDYLPDEPKRELVRRIGRRVLRERPLTWDNVLGICAIENA
jgi:5-methylthioribose kinase